MGSSIDKGVSESRSGSGVGGAETDSHLVERILSGGDSLSVSIGGERPQNLSCRALSKSDSGSEISGSHDVEGVLIHRGCDEEA